MVRLADGPQEATRRTVWRDMSGTMQHPFDLFDLSGRVAIVTGASSGLGEAIARGLAGAGATVALVARRQDRLKVLADELDGVAIGCDLADASQVDELVPQVVDQAGRPEILGNAAG